MGKLFVSSHAECFYGLLSCEQTSSRHSTELLMFAAYLMKAQLVKLKRANFESCSHMKIYNMKVNFNEVNFVPLCHK